MRTVLSQGKVLNLNTTDKGPHKVGMPIIKVRSCLTSSAASKTAVMLDALTSRAANLGRTY
jgi:2,3-bisphosphoglycerate-independent phosphoglycerate mutase